LGHPLFTDYAYGVRRGREKHLEYRCKVSLKYKNSETAYGNIMIKEYILPTTPPFGHPSFGKEGNPCGIRVKATL
jgi:hypothetical protein